MFLLVTLLANKLHLDPQYLYRIFRKSEQYQPKLAINAAGLVLYPQKTSGKYQFSDVISDYKEIKDMKWVKSIIIIICQI